MQYHIKITGLSNYNKKISNIKNLRSATGFGLKESKDIIEAVIAHGSCAIQLDAGIDKRVVIENLRSLGFLVEKHLYMNQYQSEFEEVKEAINILTKIALSKNLFNVVKNIADIAEVFKYELRESQPTDLHIDDFGL